MNHPVTILTNNLSLFKCFFFFFSLQLKTPHVHYTHPNQSRSDEVSALQSFGPHSVDLLIWASNFRAARLFRHFAFMLVWTIFFHRSSSSFVVVIG